MKKLMIAAAVVCAASFAQAVTYNWMTGPVIEYGSDNIDTANWVGGQFYLMQGNDAAAQAAVNAIIAANATDLAGGFNTQVAGAFNSATYDASSYTLGGAANGTWSDISGGIEWVDESATGTLPFYQLIFDAANNAFYVSEVAYSDYTIVADTNIGIYNLGYDTFVDAESYQGAGWYGFTTGGGGGGDDPGSGGVPEPTSGLLMLVGLAGLALRRKLA